MLDPVNIITTAGLLGVALVVFTESAFFFGFFLPGDTLLFASGIFALQGFFPLWLIILCIASASILGNSVGYWTGKKIGRKFFEREASLFFNKKRIYDAEHFYERHGAITIVIARFIPIVRTFAPIIAGVGQMKKITFIIFNIIGGFLWAIVVPSIGYYFGSLIPNSDRFLLPIVLLVIGISLLPVLFNAFRHFILRRHSHHE